MNYFTHFDNSDGNIVNISSPILVIPFLNNKPVEWILKWISGSYHNCLNSFLWDHVSVLVKKNGLRKYSNSL